MYPVAEKADNLQPLEAQIKKSTGFPQETSASPPKTWIAATPLAAWCLTIFVLSSVPGNKYPQVQWEHADKLVHFALYFWVGVFGLVFFRSRSAGPLAAAVFGILYGLSDEIHQLWVPRRTFSFTDWAADSVGVIIGIFAILALHRLRPVPQDSQQQNKQPSERMEPS